MNHNDHILRIAADIDRQSNVYSYPVLKALIEQTPLTFDMLNPADLLVAFALYNAPKHEYCEIDAEFYIEVCNQAQYMKSQVDVVCKLLDGWAPEE